MFDRRSLLVGAAAFALAAPAFAHPHDELNAERLADIERQITTFRSALKDAVASKNVAQLKDMYAEGFTHTHTTGKVDDRAARVLSLLAGEPVIETATPTELSLRVHGPDQVILTGKSSIFSKADNRSYDVRWLQAYSRASGEWQLVASQATRLPITS
jgi:Domain of unknown function (DUF4440)